MNVKHKKLNHSFTIIKDTDEIGLNSIDVYEINDFTLPSEYREEAFLYRVHEGQLQVTCVNFTENGMIPHDAINAQLSATPMTATPGTTPASVSVAQRTMSLQERDGESTRFEFGGDEEKPIFLMKHIKPFPHANVDEVTFEYVIPETEFSIQGINSILNKFYHFLLSQDMEYINNLLLSSWKPERAVIKYY